MRQGRHAAPRTSPELTDMNLQLTSDQIAAAEACGCVLVPATEEQVQRLTMQRRVFWIKGHPVLVRRGAAPFETHGTFEALTASHLAARTAAAPDAAGELVAPSETDEKLSPRHRAPLADAAVQPAVPGAMPGQDVGTARSRSRIKAAPKSSARNTVQRPTEVAAPEPPAPGLLANADVSQDISSGARVMRRWRAGQRPVPRWMTAGKARRGRLK